MMAGGISFKTFLFIAVVSCAVEARLGRKFRFPIPSEMACEGYPIVLRCPGTDVIQVVTAEYGRQTAETCATSPEKMRNTACYLPQAFDIMSTKCNNQTQCKLEVSSEHFPDPCPGTHKYLHVTFSCVKYMFGCPGSLTGIGSNVTMDTSMQAQVGGWTKDPIYNPNRVFFVSPSQPSLQEYQDMDQFVRGDRATRIYNIHYLISGTSFVIYDGNLFFVKASSRNIIKYNLQTRIRHRESAVPGHTDRASTHRNGGNNIELAVDETGLWAIYTSTHNADRIVVSLINKNSLEIEKTWRTTYPKRSAMHTFMICGVLYVVGTRTGEVEYMYNTNLASGNGRFVAIGFDRNRPISPSDPVGFRRTGREAPTAPRKRFTHPAGMLAKSRTFKNYNFTSLKYNPRDRLIYAWEATAGKAVYYNLHYGLPDPIEGDKPITTTSTITSTSTTVTTTTHERRPMVPTLGPSHPPQVPQTAPPSPSTGAGRCSAVVRDGITWPVTSQGVTRTMPCPNVEQENISWRCTTEQFTMRTIWDPAGPDMSRCVTWTSSIESGLVAGTADPSSTVESLSRGLKMSAQTADALSADEITSSARIMSVAAARANTNSAMLTRTQVRQITEGVTDAADTLLDSSNTATWEAMDGTQRYKAADDVINSVEAAGFILTESMANNYGRFQGATAVPRLLEKGDLLVQATVVVASTSQDLIFPDPTAIQRSTTWFDITDQVTLRAGDIVQQANNGVTEIVFAAYNNLGKYMDVQLMDGDKTSTEEWSIDSRVVSASIGDPDREVQLSSPVKIVLENTQDLEAPRKCVYWKYSKSQNTGVWSTEGCTVVGSNTTHTTCSCKHLTSFAVLVNVVGTKVDSWEHEMALYVVSCVGISVSLVCLIICIYTFTFFRNLQSDRNTIHKHLCISLFIAELVFLVGINQTAHKIPCAVVAGLLHYFFLAAFMWMALEGFQLYVMLVEVFEGRSRWKWYYLTGYGIPAVIVAVSAAVDPSGYGTDRACWLRVDSGFIWSFVGPVCAVILTNLIFLAITVYKMYRHTLTYTDSSKVNAVKASVRGASVLLCLLGITWAFGILWVWEQAPVMAYLFCVFNAFQGLFIFVFHCLLQKKVRNEYSRCFRHGTCCGKGSSEAYVSNSMSFSKQYTPGRYSVATATHNTTLTTQAPAAQSQLRRMWNETIVNGSRTSDTAVTHSQDLNTVPHREPPRSSVPPSTSNIQQFPSSSSPQTRRHSIERIIDSSQNRGSAQEDDVFFPPALRPRDGAPENSDDEAYQYDRLQRHCHPNCSHEHHQTMHHHASDHECSHRHHTGLHPRQGDCAAPRPHPRSQTMNHIKPTIPTVQYSDPEDRNHIRRQAFQRASTLATNPNQQMNRHWERPPSSPTRRYSHPVRPTGECAHHQERCNDASCFCPPASVAHTQHFRPYSHDGRQQHVPTGTVHGETRRRSLISSDSDDPIVNDFSASSSAGSSCGNPASLSRTTGGRMVLSGNVIHENNGGRSSADNPLQREPWTPLYRDENDLEVQRLTDPADINSGDECSQRKGLPNDCQRDSAFYQSMPDLNNSPAGVYSSASSGCSPGMVPSGEDEQRYQERLVRQSDPNNPRYVLSPPVAFRASNAGQKKPEIYEDMIIKSHGTPNPRLPNQPDVRRSRAPNSNSPLYNQPLLDRHSAEHEPSESDASIPGRMMTCL